MSRISFSILYGLSWVPLFFLPTTGDGAGDWVIGSVWGGLWTVWFLNKMMDADMKDLMKDQEKRLKRERERWNRHP